MTLEKLGISSWPFDVVPPTSGTTQWTGRHDFKSNLDRVAGNWGFIPTSSIVSANSCLSFFKLLTPLK